MKTNFPDTTRRVTVRDFEVLVPARITRIETRGTRGWQVRWALSETEKTMMVSDGAGNARGSLVRACTILAARLRANPPKHEAKLRVVSQVNKTDKRLPTGVYGPSVRVVSKKVKGKKAVKTEVNSYDVYAPKLDINTGRSSPQVRHFTWRGSLNASGASKAKQRAIAFREAGVEKFLEDCEKYNVKRLKHELALVKAAVQFNKRVSVTQKEEVFYT